MKTYTVKTTLKKLILESDYITICSDFKPIYVNVEDDEFPNMVQLQFEVKNAKDYTKQEIIEKYDLKTKVVKWFYGYTEDGKNGSIVVVLDEEN